MTKAKYGDLRERQRAAARALREKLLEELALGPRTMRELVAKFGLERDMLHRALLVLRQAGTATSAVDRRMNVQGIVAGATWMLVGDTLPAREDRDPDDKSRRNVARGPWPTPPRDPLLWALYGAQPA